MVFIVWGMVMPIYEYRCGACGYQKEFLQRMSDAPLTACPKCGKRGFKKLVSAAGFQLKGTGWYATDFKNSGAKPAAKQDKSETTQDKSAAKQDKSETTQDKSEAKQDKSETKQDKSKTKQDKSAANPGNESSKTDASAAPAPARPAASR
jgi:putative FmdB family regulatory protein